MLSDAIAWACHSPRRLAVAIGAPLVVIVVIGSWLAQQGTPAGAATLRGSSPAPVAGPTATEVARVPDTRPFVDAAVRFTRAWAHLAPGQTAEQWRIALAPLITSDLAAGLAQTDPGALPGGAPTGQPVVRFVAQGSALVAVPLSTGKTVVVTVVDRDGVWKIADVQPDVGDYGAST
jgi:hypothetical protein